MNLKYLRNLTTNEFSLNDNEKFTAIIGLNPSTGARSPVLWNSVFKKYYNNLKMIPLDVEEKNTYELLKILEDNINFLGGAVSAPYKEIVY